MKKNKRKIKLIDRGFQYRLMAKFILLNTVIMVIFGVLIYIFFRSEISTNLATAHAVYRNMSHMVLPIVLTLSVLNILFSAGVIAFMVLYWSHKIAGPLYRFNEVLKEVSQRNLNPMSNIREKDQLKQLSASFGNMTDTLSADFTEIKKVVTQMKELMEQQAVPGELKEKVDQLEALTGKYRL